jgi:CO dehydrogenase nickel-insertion accessory protein CooC1
MMVTSVLCVQAYAIATSTQVNISKVDVSKFDDSYFKAQEKKDKKKTEENFFEDKAEDKKLSQEYIDNQKKVQTCGLWHCTACSCPAAAMQRLRTLVTPQCAT